MKRNRHRLILSPKTTLPVTLALTLFLSSCVLPLDDATISSLMKGLAADNASACLSVNAGGGAGAVFPAPAIPVGGGYASLVACRSNEPGSVIVVKANGDLEIYHGVFKIPVEERELKELRERLKKFEDMPSVLIVPRPTDEF